MGVEYILSDGRGVNEGAFDKSSVFVENPHKLCDAELLRKLKTFPQKKMAVDFCRQWNIDFVSVVKFQTRFQYSWGINLGRNNFVPNYAEGYMIAKSLGRTLDRVEVSI